MSVMAGDHLPRNAARHLPGGLPDAEVLTDVSPALDIDWVRDLAKSHYGLSGELRALSGERDRNYRLRVSDQGVGDQQVRNEQAGDDRAADGAHFMLKISHPAESALVADFQTQALRHLAAADPGLPVQRIVPTRDGAPSFLADPGDGRARVVRLFTYLPGLPMPDAPRSTPQRTNLARTLARLDLALCGFTHPAGALALPWDIQRADGVRGLLVHIEGAERRALAERALDRFERVAKPVLPQLRAQPIHNDFNIYNVLVDPADTDRIAGVLDFGDMVHAPLIDDLAVAASYQLGTGKPGSGSGSEPLADILPFVAAYHAVLPLQREEIDLLFTLMTARLVMVVAISGWRAARQLDNAAYVLRNNPLSWARLAACEQVGDMAASAALRRACGLP